MSVSVEALNAALPEIEFQEASMDIWDKKYRLKSKGGEIVDETIDDTYKRIARALADAEQGADAREHWYREFLWALRRGVIPAGRITSNAGAQAYKPSTSTINCTVSGTIMDSMNDILGKVHEAGLTLKAGCGIGYEFSTLRPRGAYVSGAGAHTSGPMSFMDIYDKMCFTVSSAGGRRGAQMATFDVAHPDVMDFIRAKRENGVLRQFNCSLLITDAFIEAVKNEADWPLVFPVLDSEADEVDVNDPEQVVWREWPIKSGYISNEEGLVACRIYKKVPAKRLWNMIMSSTYDYAEPGFILIDQYNVMNNNWWCENIRATNPCVTADTWIHTAEGPRQVADLVNRPFLARVDGQDHAAGPEGFFRTATKSVFRLTTAEGYELRLTEDHRVRRVSQFTRYKATTEWCEAGKLVPGDRVVLNDHRENAEWDGRYTREQGYLLGLLVGDGTLKKDEAVLSAWKPAAVANGSPSGGGVEAVMANARLIHHPSYCGAARPASAAFRSVASPHRTGEYACGLLGRETPQPLGLTAPRDGRVVNKAGEALAAAQTLPHRSDFKGWAEISGRNEYRMTLAAVRDLALEVGMKPGDKAVTPQVEQASSSFYRGFLRGLFDANGSVQGSQLKGVSVRLAQSDLDRLKAVQRMLLRIGIASRLYRDRRTAGSTSLPDGRGGHADYNTAAQHELVIAGENLARFDQEVGFADHEKSDRLKQSLDGYKRTLNRERFVARVVAVENDGVEDVYDVQVPGINTFDGNGLHAHNCGEQGLPPYGSCLLGSVNLTRFVDKPFTEEAGFNWDEYRKAVKIFTRMLDNVVEVNGLPLEKQRHEIEYKRRHGMGFLGLGSTLTMLGQKYGKPESLEFTEKVSREMAVAGWETGLELAEEKGPAPIMVDEFEVTPEMLRKRPEMVRDGYKPGDKVPGRVLHARYSRYMQKVAEVAPKLVDKLAETGARFSHHSSIAPTGTISLSLANNASNGIEPSFAHHYNRNVIREGRKTKEKVSVYSYELLAYRTLVNPKAMPFSEDPEEQLPEYFVTSEAVTPKEHVAIQAAAQKWIDSSISKTANVPTDYPYEDFKDIYLYAWEQGLKGCTTFRFNPEAFQGVLVTDKDLENTTYVFELEDGSTIELKGGEEVEYDGETHTAANLFDALKEGYYGKF